MKEKLKTEGVSILITFVSSFLLIVGMSLQNIGDVKLDSVAIIAIIVAGARAAVKAVIEKQLLKSVGAAPKK
jgi:hypothetical protein